MAADLGIHYAETLTGFKWLCRPALAHPDWTQVLAYEEALGYAIGPGMRDKDGIAAALCITRLVCDLTALGRTVDDELDELDRTFGVFATHNISTSISPEARACLDELVGHPPHLLAGCPVVACTEPNGPGMVRIDIEGGHRVVLRPSGTEPKLKIYCEATIPVPQEGAPDDTSLTSIRVQAALLADRLAEESLGLLRGSTP